MTKVCAKCGVEKDISCFSPGKVRCKPCRSEDSKKYYEEHKPERAAYSAKHAKQHEEEIKSYHTIYRKEHAEELAEYRKTHAKEQSVRNAIYWATIRKFEEPTEEQRERKRISQRAWVKAQGPEYQEERNLYVRQRRTNNPQVRIATNLRVRLKKLLKQGYKTGHAVRDLGCTAAELKVYLESKFQSGMSWDNYGAGDDKWNIDHIIPFAVHDLTKREDVLHVCHYTNLQPLWQKENFSKGAKILITGDS
jgi:hypothetical protein